MTLFFHCISQTNSTLGVTRLIPIRIVPTQGVRPSHHHLPTPPFTPSDQNKLLGFYHVSKKRQKQQAGGDPTRRMCTPRRELNKETWVARSQGVHLARNTRHSPMGTLDETFGEDVFSIRHDREVRLALAVAVGCFETLSKFSGQRGRWSGPALGGQYLSLFVSLVFTLVFQTPAACKALLSVRWTRLRMRTSRTSRKPTRN